MNEKLLYHGSSVNNIEELIPILSNHDNEYVYLTDNYCLAIIYAYNPLPRPEGFFTYRFGKDGKLNYDEYFSNQLEKMYKNKKGYVYIVKDNGFKQLKNNPWTFLSDKNVTIIKKIVIEDIYLELLRQNELGSITINFYDFQNDKYKQNAKNIVLDYMKSKNIISEEDSFYRFVKEYIPDLIQKK